MLDAALTPDIDFKMMMTVLVTSARHRRKKKSPRSHGNGMAINDLSVCIVLNADWQSFLQ